MKKLLIAVLFFGVSGAVSAQTYVDEDGRVWPDRCEALKDSLPWGSPEAWRADAKRSRREFKNAEHRFFIAQKKLAKELSKEYESPSVRHIKIRIEGAKRNMIYFARKAEREEAAAIEAEKINAESNAKMEKCRGRLGIPPPLP